MQYIGGRFILGDDTDSVNVIAWMPTPEPYSDGNSPKQTNADQIRGMTDEELAKFLPILSDFMCRPTEECIKNTIMNYCGECEKTEACAIKWLRSESEEDENG